MRTLFAAAGLVVAAILVVQHRHPASANAEPAVTRVSSSLFSIGDDPLLRQELENAKGNLSLVQAQLERANKIIGFSTRYGVPAGLTTKIFDAAVREGIDPELAFRLVRLESEFNPRAVSRVGAVGLTQLMPSTARIYDKSLTQAKLFQPEVNLRVGMRYLHNLLDQFHGNVRLALLAYNRGEDAVWRDVKAGVNPGNGYAKSVVGNYKGTGTIE